MMRALAACAVLLLLAACGPAGTRAHTEQDWRTCEGQTYPDQRIEACSVVIADAAADPQRRAAALVLRGVLRADAGQQARAVADFGRALRLDANNVSAYVERGFVHESRGAFGVAVRDYDAALALQPNFALAAERRETALQGEAQAALTALDTITQAITRNPRNAELWNNRCWERAVRGLELEFALSDCDEAVRLAPQYAQAWDSRGLVHLKRGEFAAALADYNAAVALEPREGHYLYGRGVAQLQLGDAAAAEQDFQAAERARPGVAQLYRSYGVVI